MADYTHRESKESWLISHIIDNMSMLDVRMFIEGRLYDSFRDESDEYIDEFFMEKYNGL
jgi:hypothetical protein